MNKLTVLVCLALLTIGMAPLDLRADGISVDAGITPAEGRWMLRTMVRYIARSNDNAMMPGEMTNYIVNTVLAYGVTRDLTIMIRQPLVDREMRMGNTTIERSGLNDFSILAKYKIYRKNTRNFTIGLATTTQVTLPTGSDEISSGTTNVRPGLYASLRSGRWGAAANIHYDWRGIDGENEVGLDPGNEFGADFALSYRFSVGSEGRSVITPVLELTYRDREMDALGGIDLANTGEDYLLLSPGMKYTYDSFVLEGLVQIPISQNPNGMLLERDTAALIGFRYMF